MIVGKAKKLQFELTLSGHDKALGRGYIRAYVGDSSIWGDEELHRGISWTWIDLLEQLARSWPFLKYEESGPREVHDLLALLRDGRTSPADYDFEPMVQECTKEAYVFVRRHNLATGIEGLYLPSLSLLREGMKMWVVSSVVRKLLDFA